MERLIDFLARLVSRGYELKTIFDIGSCKGDWARGMKSSFPATELVLFEGNPAYKPALESSGFRFFNVVLSNPGREFVEFYNGTNTGDSYYKETTRFYDQQGSIKLPCHTLDEIVTREALPIPNLIKIDTQGSEIDILRGFESRLGEVDFVYTECPIIEYNRGAPDIYSYLDFFKRNRFVPFDVLETHRLENVLLQVDILFVNNRAKERLFEKNTMIRPFA